MEYKDFLELPNKHQNILIESMSDKLLDIAFTEESINLITLGRLNDIGIRLDDIMCDYIKWNYFCEFKFNEKNIDFNILLTEMLAYGFINHQEQSMIKSTLNSYENIEFSFSCKKRYKKLLEFYVYNNNGLHVDLIDSFQEALDKTLDHILDLINNDLGKEKERLTNNSEVIFNLFNESFDFDKFYESEVGDFANS